MGKTRCSLRVMVHAAITLLALGSADPALAQDARDDVPGRLRGSGFVSWGSGPSPSAAFGGRISFQLAGPVVAFSEYAIWRTGVLVACQDSLPESYTCSVRGHSIFGGLQFEPDWEVALRPFVELAAGSFVRDGGVVEGANSLAWLGGVGLRLRAGGRTSWKVSWRHVGAEDRIYEDLLGEGLAFSVLSVELEIHPGD